MSPFTVIVLFIVGSFANAVDLDMDIEGNLYVVDSERNLLIQYSPEGDSLAAVGGFGRSVESFDQPVAVYARRGTDVFVADYNNHRIQRFDRRLDYVTTLRTRDDPDEEVRFGYPMDVAVSRQGEVLVLDSENRRVAVFSASGRFVRSFGDVGDGMGRIVDPTHLELDDADNVYVVDDGAIKVYDPFGGWIRHVPLPRGFDVRSCSIERDTMTVLGTSSTLWYDLSVGGYTAPARFESDAGVRQVRYRAGRLYEVFQDNVRVSRFPDTDEDDGAEDDGTE